MSPRHRAGQPVAGHRRNRAVAAVAAVPALASTFTTGSFAAVPVTETAAAAEHTPTSISVVDPTPEPRNLGAFDAQDVARLGNRAEFGARTEADRLAAEAEAKRLAEEEAARLAAEQAAQEKREREQREREEANTRDLDDDEIEQVRREAPEPDAAPEAEPRPSSSPNAGTATGVINSAKKYLGLAYVWGGTTPAGFDCSGLTQYVYKKHGVNLPRVSRDQAKAGVAVSRAEAQPGDLVFYGSPVHHVGIYLGDGKMLHSPKRGDVVKISSLWSDSTMKFRRVL